MEENIAPTDSRHRDDQRLMENTKWDEANIEKLVRTIYSSIFREP